MSQELPWRGIHDCTCNQDAGRCWCTVASVAPLECLPCVRSGLRDQVYAEIPIGGDWKGRGFVMRVGCICDLCGEISDKDASRSEFEPYAAAIQAWNDMQLKPPAD